MNRSLLVAKVITKFATANGNANANQITIKYEHTKQSTCKRF